MTDTLLRRCAVTLGCGAIALAAYTWLAPPRYRATAAVVAPQPDAHVVEFSAVQSSPDGAAAAANAAARAYVAQARDQVRAQRTPAVIAAEQRRDREAARVVMLEQELHDLMRRTATDPAARAAWMRLAAQRDGARRARRDLEAAQAQIASAPDPLVTPVLLHDAMLTRQRLRLAALEARRVPLAIRYGPAHAELQAVDEEIARARADLQQLTQEVAASIGAAADKARIREAAIQAQLDAAERRAVQAARAASEVRAARDAIARARAASADRLREAQALRAEVASAASDVRQISTAVPPAVPYQPATPGVWLLLGLAAICRAAEPLARRRERLAVVEHAIAREMAAYARTEPPLPVAPYSHQRAA